MDWAVGGIPVADHFTMLIWFMVFGSVIGGSLVFAVKVAHPLPFSLVFVVGDRSISRTPGVGFACCGGTQG